MYFAGNSARTVVLATANILVILTLPTEGNEDLEVKALLDFISGFSEKAQRSALMQVLLLLPGENGKGKS